MNVIAKTRLDIVPLSKHIGAEIRGSICAKAR